MNKKLRAVPLGVVGTLLVLALGQGPAHALANPTISRPARACTAIDAPLALNSIPASNDCAETPLASDALASPTLVNPTTVLSSTPKAFDTTDGDILAITKVVGAATPRLAIGGNFTHVITPDRVSHSATNFAIIDESTGAVLFAGNANSYVRAITSNAGTVYLGGDFTSLNGVTRSRAAAVSASGTVTSWNPAPGARVRGMAADSTGVYLGGDWGSVRKVSLSSGATTWSKSVTSGPVRALMVTGGYLYIGGLFETYAGITQHGLIKANPGDGSVVTAFNARLRADTGVGKYGSYDGEGVLAIVPGVTSTTIVIGIGGNAPAGLSSNETIVIQAGSGARVWRVGTIGDTQALGVVGDTVVSGWHRNTNNTTIPWPYFAGQLEGSNGALTTWDPKITGNQNNADGGNNGVQAIYSDASTKTLFLAGAFTQWNYTWTHKSLIAFSWS